MKRMVNRDLKTILMRTALFLLAILGPFVAFSQTASNIRLRSDPTIKKLIIEYDLRDIQPTDSLYILIETASGQVITPRAITGAVGKGLRSGNNQAAYWDVVQDNARINETIQARVQFIRPVVTAVAEPPKPGPKTSFDNPNVSVRKKSPVPIIGYVLTGGLAIYGGVLASAISKDSQTYTSKEFVTTTDEKAQYDDMLSSLKSRKSTLTLVVGTAVAVGVATTLYTLLRKPKRISITSPPGPRSINLGLAYRF